MLITATLLFWVAVVTFISPWYTITGVLLSLFLFGKKPFWSLRLLLWETLVWPVLLIKWIIVGRR